MISTLGMAMDFFGYHGRTDDMLKVGGICVSPIEIESVLINHSDVLEVAVIGDDFGNGLMKLKAFVVLKEGVEGDEKKKRNKKIMLEATLQNISTQEKSFYG